jgi:8-hydroxy-5-deazaflavin:NADPH oxidoreductase
MRFGVLGSGRVGQTLSEGLKRHGYEVRIATRSPAKLEEFSSRTGIAVGTPVEIAEWAEALVLAVLGSAAEAVLDEAGHRHLNGKLVIDATNPLSSDPPEDGVLRVFTGPNESLMEHLQDAVPQAHFVKAFNSVGYALMVDPSLPGGPPTMFYCGNDAGAKAVVARLLDQFGWDAVDMGTAKAARAIEPLCQLWCIPGFREGRWMHAFKLLRGDGSRDALV